MTCSVDGTRNQKRMKKDARGTRVVACIIVCVKTYVYVRCESNELQSWLTVQE